MLIVLFGATIVLISIGLRVRSAIFEYRTVWIVHHLALLRLDEAPTSESLKLLREMRPCAAVELKPINGECYEIQMTRWLDSLWLGKYGYEAGYWVGIRYWNFSASVEIRQGKVHSVRYSLLVNDGSLASPGVSSIAVNSVHGFRTSYLDPSEDESPEYRVTTNFKWPDHSMRVDFTPDAPANLIQHAFAVRLGCIRSLRGCQTALELLPAAAEDYQRIRQATVARLISSNPCPNRILYRHARDVSDILLLEVTNIHSELEQFGHEQEKIADYRLLEILKGKLERPLKNVGHPLKIVAIANTIENPALGLLHPGSRVLMFTDSSTDVDSPCEIMPATEEATKTIRGVLQTSHHEELDPSDFDQW